MIVRAEVIDRSEFDHLLRPTTFHGIELEEAPLIEASCDEVGYRVGESVTVSIEGGRVSILGAA